MPTRRVLLGLCNIQLVVLLVMSACLLGCPAPDKLPKNFDPDKKSGPDGKRSGAQLIAINHSKTDEVSYRGQDRTDWYVVTLKGPPNVLQMEVHWDNVKSDLMVDVFDEFGKQLSASPTRAPGTTQKTLLTQIDHPGVYYIRISAPKPDDGTVYTMEAKWDAGSEVPIITPPPVVPPVVVPPTHTDHTPRTHPHTTTTPVVHEGPSETIEGHIVTAYREGGQLTIHLDKGSAAGVKVGQSGIILSGPSGEDPLSGGAFRVVEVLDANKSVARCAITTLGKNSRVAITVR
jgi:hypothetical protein